METELKQEECATFAEAHKEHRWLHKLVGDWTVEGEAAGEPGKPSEKFSGTESVRLIGEVWVLAEGRGEMPGGGEAHMITTIGYDPRKESYVGTFFGSMMTHLWIYEGSLDPAEKALSLNAVGPSWTDQTKMTQFRDVIEFQDDSHRTLTSYFLDDEGNWQQMMKADYRKSQ